MDPLNPIKPTFLNPNLRNRSGKKVKRREPGTGGDLQKQDNLDQERHKPASGDHQVDELA
jgi:hypothetical protein